MKKIITLFIGFICSYAHAYNVETRPGSQIYLSIPKDGTTTLQFSEPVKAISGGKQFKLQPIGSDIDERTRRELNPQVFNVSPLSPEAEELVTFVFNEKDGEARTLAIRLKTKEQATSFYNIKFPKRIRTNGLKGFLSSETAMMISMIKDEEAYARQSFSENIRIKNLSDVDIKLVRRFESEGLRGYTFLVSNTTRKAISINLSALNFGKNRQAVMAHVDHEILEPCSKNNSRNPQENSCTTALRLIVRGEEDLSHLSALGGKFPFTQSKEEGVNELKN